MSIKVRIALVMLVTVVPACASYRPSAYLPDTYKTQILKDLGDPKLLETYNALPYANATDIAFKVTRRNQILQELIWVIDQNYGDFEQSYYGSDAGINFGGDVLNLGLTGVAAVSGTAHVKSILSAIATGATGVKTSYLKNFYDQQTRTAVVQQMRASRATELATIQDKDHMKASVVQSGGVAAYGLEQGLSDIDSYFNAGTIIGALQAIAQAAGKAQDDAKTEQKTNSQTQQVF